MHKRFALALVFLPILVFSACQGSDTKSLVSLVPSDELLSFRLDENTSNISDFLAYYNETSNSEGMLFSLNRPKNEIQVYGIESQRLINRLPLDLEGDRGVGSISGFHVQNLDSIFLFPNNGNRFFLTNIQRETITRFDYDVPEGYGNAQLAKTYFSANTYLHDGKLFTKNLYQGNYSNINNQELSAKYLSSQIDLTTGHIEHLPMTYPDDYMSNVKKHFQFSFSASENGMVYSLWADHHLYRVDLSTSRITKAKAQSEYLREAWEPLPLGGDRVDRARYFAASAHYGNIIFDPYRSVYYRFCYPKVNDVEEKDLRELALYPREFSVMVFDNDLNVIGEEFFEKDSNLLTTNVFVGSKGLYISVNHPDSPINEENFMRFRLYELKQ